MPNRAFDLPGLHQGGESNRTTAWRTSQGFNAFNNTWTNLSPYDTTTNFNGSTIVTWDAGKEQVKFVILSANSSITFPKNPIAGTTYILAIKQDGTGSRTLSYTNEASSSAYHVSGQANPTLGTWKWPGAITPTLSTGANKTDLISLFYDGQDLLGVAQLTF